MNRRHFFLSANLIMGKFSTLVILSDCWCYRHFTQNLHSSTTKNLVLEVPPSGLDTLVGPDLDVHQGPPHHGRVQEGNLGPQVGLKLVQVAGPGSVHLYLRVHVLKKEKCLRMSGQSQELYSAAKHKRRDMVPGGLTQVSQRKSLNRNHCV